MWYLEFECVGRRVVEDVAKYMFVEFLLAEKNAWLEVKKSGKMFKFKKVTTKTNKPREGSENRMTK